MENIIYKVTRARALFRLRLESKGKFTRYNRFWTTPNYDGTPASLEYTETPNT